MSRNARWPCSNMTLGQCTVIVELPWSPECRVPNGVETRVMSTLYSDGPLAAIFPSMREQKEHPSEGSLGRVPPYRCVCIAMVRSAYLCISLSSFASSLMSARPGVPRYVSSPLNPSNFDMGVPSLRCNKGYADLIVRPS